MPARRHRTPSARAVARSSNRITRLDKNATTPSRGYVRTPAPRRPGRERYEQLLTGQHPTVTVGGRGGLELAGIGARLRLRERHAASRPPLTSLAPMSRPGAVNEAGMVIATCTVVPGYRAAWHDSRHLLGRDDERAERATRTADVGGERQREQLEVRSSFHTPGRIAACGRGRRRAGRCVRRPTAHGRPGTLRGRRRGSTRRRGRRLRSGAPTVACGSQTTASRPDSDAIARHCSSVTMTRGQGRCASTRAPRAIVSRAVAMGSIRAAWPRSGTRSPPPAAGRCRRRTPAPDGHTSADRRRSPCRSDRAARRTRWR